MSAVLYDVPGPRARRRARIASVVATVVVAAVLGAVVAKLAVQGQFQADFWTPFTNPQIWEQILLALVATVRAALFAIVLALGFGLVFSMARLSARAWLRWPATLVVEFFRAVPLLLLILVLFIGFGGQFADLGDKVADPLPSTLAEITGLDQLGAMAPLVIALMLYNGSVLAEVFRAGILAVPRGQEEAAYALGLAKSAVLRLVLLPQAIRIMLPAIVSQCVVALKDTALGFVIAYEELVRYGRNVYTAYGNIIPAMLVVAVIYIGLNMSVSRIAVWLERRQSQRYDAKAIARVEQQVEQVPA